MASAPIITFRNDTSPYSVISTLTYSETVAKETGLPTLAGYNSDTLTFRIFNNFGLATGIASAYNIFLTTYDDGSGANSATKSVISQMWTDVYEAGVGEGASAPGALYAIYNAPPTSIGGSASIFTPPIASNAVPGAIIRAGSDTNSCGFIQVKTFLNPSLTAGMATWSFAIVMVYDWNS